MKDLRVEPLGNRVYVKKLQSSDTTESGLYVAGGVLQIGSEVIAVGDGVKSEKLKPGVKVLTVNVTNPLTMVDNEHYFVNEEEILSLLVDVEDDTCCGDGSNCACCSNTSDK